MPGATDFPDAAQTEGEIRAFVEAFARVTVHRTKEALGSPAAEAAEAEESLNPDWDDPLKLEQSGLALERVDTSTRRGRKYLHIDVATSPAGRAARRLFLAFSGLSEKQQKVLFPQLRSGSGDAVTLSSEVGRLNAWLDEIREGGFDPSAFVTYQRSVRIHGRSQNLSGAIGAAGAAIAFADAVSELKPGSIVDSVGEIPPSGVRSPVQLYDWRESTQDSTTRALLLANGRAVVFASSKDANVFMPLGNAFVSAADALKRFTHVASDQRARSQMLHEFAVGEIKTATDPANLYERLGLASRETQTELRTDRFLMMSILNQQLLSGGTQQRTINNRDLTRFSHVFNLHHCWGWDGGRERHPAHWEYFKTSIGEWCGL